MLALNHNAGKSYTSIYKTSNNAINTEIEILKLLTVMSYALNEYKMKRMRKDESMTFSSDNHVANFAKLATMKLEVVLIERKINTERR